MNRTVKLALGLIATATSIATLAGLVWAWREGLIGGETIHRPLLLAFLLVVPATMWVSLAWASRQLSSATPRLAGDHRRHLQGQLGFYFCLLAALQAWLVNLYIQAVSPPLDRESFARVAFVLMGVAMAVRGNFVAKIGPPTGDGAPDPGAWTRSLLRTGWALTLLGATLVLSGLFLPVRAMLFIVPPVAAALILAGQAHRRAVRTPATTR
jgi:hypothetical protein